MTPISLTPGYLIVLVDSGYINALNPNYAGVDRLTPYAPHPYATHFPEETEVLEDYVFGDHKRRDDSSLIVEYSKALELWRRFAVSRRAYEILLCSSGPADGEIENIDPRSATIISLGYDVAGISGDCWSIVQDLPDSQWAQPYVQRLNGHGLFTTRQDAEAYLQDYITKQEADWDLPFEIVFVMKIAPSAVGVALTQ